MNTPTPPSAAEGVILEPHYGVALTITLAGLLGLLLIPLWGTWALGGGIAISLFGLFLAAQTALLRLQFSSEALLVWRRDQLLRRFPYAEWIGWRIFWGPLPALFYFREQSSIHFLPVLFDAGELRKQLNLHLP